MLTNLTNFLKHISTIAANIKLILIITFLLWLLFITIKVTTLIQTSPLGHDFIFLLDILTQHEWITHAVGIASGLILIALINHQHSDLIVYIVDIIAKKKTFNPEYLYETLFSEKQARKRLIEFSQDGSQLYLLASSANFLNTDIEQVEEITKFKNQCKLLIKLDYEIDTDKLYKIMACGVLVRAYPDSTPALRGRLKITSFGRSACLFDRKGGLYRLLEIENLAIIDMLFKQYHDWFERGYNPLIKHVIFDLGNVLLDGEFHDFLLQVEKITGKKINPKSDDYLCASEELNLGDIGIQKYVETNIGRPLSEKESREIVSIWNNTWSINDGVNNLAWKLKNNGYTISLFSNCDKENGDVYELKNYLDVFDHRFFSFDLKILKPQKEFFHKMLSTLGVKPYECVVIDDHKSNIDMATTLGFNAVYVRRSIPKKTRDAFITQELLKIQLKLESD